MTKLMLMALEDALRKMALSDWHLRLTQEEADALRDVLRALPAELVSCLPRQKVLSSKNNDDLLAELLRVDDALKTLSLAYLCDRWLLPPERRHE